MNIREQRKKLGLSQTEAAKRIGVSLSAYLLWERGAGNPNEVNLQRLNEVLGDGTTPEPEKPATTQM